MGVTVTRVQQLITSGRLPAKKIGRDYVIEEVDLTLLEDRRPGRPRKPTSSTKSPSAAAKRDGRK